MSDFDREAERERLREKYEQDRKEREDAEQMSELLLQGATMTNAHCSSCGDPIFRYDGQEFCATCERPVDREDGTGANDEPDSGTGEDGDGGPSTVEVTTPRDDTRVAFGDPEADPESSGRQKGTDSAHQDPTPDSTGPARDDQPAVSQQDRDDTAGVEAARASLVRTLAAFSQRAEATEDPRRAREHLQTAREAAEALATLRQ